MKRSLIALAGAVLAVALAPGAAARVSAPPDAQLWILHVQNGGHVWSDGKRKAATMTLTLQRGQTLAVANRDEAAHQLVQLAGPKLALGGPVMVNHRALVRFEKPGLYRFRTKAIELPAMPDVHTVGPDNVLRLTVRVT